MARTGTGTISSGMYIKTVADTNCLTASQVSVCLTSNPSSAAGGAVVEWISKSNGVGFTIYLANPVQVDTVYDYLLS